MTLALTRRLPTLCLLFSLLGMGAIACKVGPIEMSFSDILTVIWGKLTLNKTISGNLAVEEAVLFSIRFPRIVLGVIMGATLAMAGAVLQGLFRNPLADPSLIGVSSGGAMGAVTVIVLGNSLFSELSGINTMWLIAVCAMIGGISVTFFIYRLSKIHGQVHMATMLLMGVAVNAFAAAVIGFLVYLSADDELRDLTYWAMGSLANASWSHVLVALCFVTLPWVGIFKYRKLLNAFLLGEAEAYYLGVKTHSIKRNLIFLSAGMVGVSVALCGTIGFIGLVIPHLVRIVMGPDHRHLIPNAALLGALVLVAADVMARTVVAPAQLPIGVVTALMGAPFFLWLLWRSKVRGVR